MKSNDEGLTYSNTITQPTHAFIKLGLEHFKKKDWKEAKQAFLNALNFDTDSPLCRYHLGLIELNLNNFDAAERIFGELICMDEGNRSYVKQLVEVMIRTNRHTEAIETLENYQNIGTLDLGCFLALGRSYSALSRWQEAKLAYEKALEFDHTSQHCRYQLCHIEIQLFNYKLAEEMLHSLIIDNQSNTYFILTLADILWRMERRYEALDLLEESISKVKEPALVYAKLGSFYLSLDDITNAKSVYKKALELDPGKEINRFQLAWSECRSGNWTEAKQIFSTILSGKKVQEHWIRTYCDYCLEFDDIDALQELQCSDFIKNYYLYNYKNRKIAKELYGDVPGYSEKFLKEIWSFPGFGYVGNSIAANDIESEFLNVVNGRRKTIDNPAEASSTIYLFGRSRVFGYYLDDSSTIASRLQQRFNKSNCKSTRIVNCAVGGYNEPNIFLQFLRAQVEHGDKVVVFVGNVSKLTGKYFLENMNYHLAILDECIKRGVDCHFVVLPFLFHMKNPSWREEKIIENFKITNENADAENNNTMYDFLCKHTPSCQSFADILDRPHQLGEIALDGAHWNHRINEVIAARVFDILSSDVPMSRRSDSIVTCEQVLPNAIKFLKKDIEKKYSENPSVRTWLKDVAQAHFPKQGNIGAIVMNCNPFSLGHLHLAQMASKNMDALYIFVVEENKSFFSFDDRIKLVKRGVRKLGDKVAVVPSGKFIISSFSFPGYFTKEEAIHAADSTTDIALFGAVIAPTLNITHRFVGEEPTCLITNAYNDSMRFLLPSMGVDLHIIPRIEKGGIPISASEIRKALKNGDYQRIRELTPPTTYDYLVNLPKETFAGQ